MYLLKFLGRVGYPLVKRKRENLQHKKHKSSSSISKNEAMQDQELIY